MNSSHGTHPSYFALDRASLGVRAADVQAHVAACHACRGYLESLEQTAPIGLTEVKGRVANRARHWRWAWAGAALVAAAAGLLLVGSQPPPSSPEPPLYVGDKGFSSVWIYVRHGASTALWDGTKPLYAGDRLRLKIDPGRFERVEVYSTKAPAAPELLYAGSLVPRQSSTLPDAWEIDGEPGDERLLVVLCNQPVKPSWPDWLNGKSPPDVLLLPFVLPKSGKPDPGPAPSNQ